MCKLHIGTSIAIGQDFGRETAGFGVDPVDLPMDTSGALPPSSKSSAIVEETADVTFASTYIDT